MSGARGDALEWALALARAPGERHALRQRALPEGIEALLQIAAGSHGGALQAAMARSAESESELVEAVRFYLREVLFHSGADAYRMLGLAHDASNEQIKGHHRLLQQWLHPDRHTSDWDAIFAGRVNAAWNALRTPERRATYDVSHPMVTALTPAATRWTAPRVMAGEPIPADAHGDRWRRRAPVLALFAACGVLGIAAVRDALREPDSGYSATVQDVQPKAEADAVALQLPNPAHRAARSERASPPRRPTPTGARSVSARAPPAAVNKQATVAPKPPDPKVLPAPVAVSRPPPPIALPRLSVAVAAAPLPTRAPATAPIAPPPLSHLPPRRRRLNPRCRLRRCPARRPPSPLNRPLRRQRPRPPRSASSRPSALAASYSPSCPGQGPRSRRSGTAWPRSNARCACARRCTPAATPAPATRSGGWPGRMRR